MLLVSALATTVIGETQLELVDGRVLVGTDLRREGGEYVLTLDTGDTIALPVELVAAVRLGGKGDKRERPPFETEPRELGTAPPPGPTGIRRTEAETLAGYETSTPKTREQLAAFGEPATWQRSGIDPTWRPESDWDMDPVKQNNFAPSTWAKPSIDPNWTPTSAFDEDEDVLAAGRSTWRQSGINSTWTPTDGFKKE